MKKKNRGVTMKVDDDFYKMVQKARIKLKLEHGIKIKSDMQFTGYLSKKPNIFSNKSLLKQIKRLRL